MYVFRVQDSRKEVEKGSRGNICSVWLRMRDDLGRGVGLGPRPAPSPNSQAWSCPGWGVPCDDDRCGKMGRGQTYH